MDSVFNPGSPKLENHFFCYLKKKTQPDLYKDGNQFFQEKNYKRFNLQLVSVECYLLAVLPQIFF